MKSFAMRTGSEGGFSDSRERRAILRVALGTVQVFGASASLVLLFLTGVNVWSLASVVVTCLFTTVSVLLFGDRKRGRRAHRNGDH